MSSQHQPIWCREVIKVTADLTAGHEASVTCALIQILPSSFPPQPVLFSSWGWCSDDCLWGRMKHFLDTIILYFSGSREPLLWISSPFGVFWKVCLGNGYKHIPPFATNSPPEVRVWWWGHGAARSSKELSPSSKLIFVSLVTHFTKDGVLSET